MGMAAVQLAPGRTFDGQRLYEHVRTWLPSYAVPHFIRIQVSSGWQWLVGGRSWPWEPQLELQSLSLQDTLEITNTFKLVKSRLVREGFNMGVIADSLFVLDNQAQAFRPLTHETYQAVCEGTWKL